MVACDRARKIDRLSALSAIDMGLGHGELSLRISLRARVFELHSSEETARTLNYYCYYCSRSQPSHVSHSDRAE
jgi:hypothetical protein